MPQGAISAADATRGQPEPFPAIMARLAEHGFPRAYFSAGDREWVALIGIFDDRVDLTHGRGPDGESALRDLDARLRGMESRREAEAIGAVKVRLGRHGEDCGSDDWYSEQCGDSAFAHTWSRGKHGGWFEAQAPTEDAAIRALDAKLRAAEKPVAAAIDPTGVRFDHPSPPSVGRLRRVLLTEAEHADIEAMDGDDEGDGPLSRVGLPGDAMVIGTEWDPGRHCFVATADCKRWPEVLLGDEVPFHPRHGR